jgi:7-carboxy-7-deazaguanine synthase
LQHAAIFPFDLFISTNNKMSITAYTLPLMEDFYTIQGEGAHTGEAAYFIRLAGCDVGCSWCDVKESWDEKNHRRETIGQIAMRAKSFHARAVVVTGGEPLMHDLTELCRHLKNDGFQTWLETSGAYPLSGQWDWICVSPKKFKAPLPEVLSSANELKVVVFNSSDFNWAEKHKAMVNDDCKLYLQPEFGVFHKTMPLIVDYVKQHPEWKISLQAHKVMQVP